MESKKAINEQHPPSKEQMWKMIAITLCVTLVLTLLVFASFFNAKKRSGELIFPAGITYLGTTATPAPEPSIPELGKKYSAQANAAWNVWTGKIYPYSFSYPETLPVTSFPNDPTDTVAVEWGTMRPQDNVLFNITKIADIEALKPYRWKPKKELVKNWWEQFSGLKGVSSVTEFTNSKKMKGYKAKYINLDGDTPNDDVFFDIPRRGDLVVRFGNGVLEADVFEKIIDSFEWKEATPSTRRVE